MEVDYQVSSADVRAWMNFAIDEAGEIKRSRRTVYLLLPIFGLLLGFLLWGGTGALFGFLAAAALAALLMPWLLKRMLDQRINAELAAVPAGLIGPHRLELTPDSLRWRTSMIDATWRREAVRDVRLTDTHGFIRFGPSNALIVPLDDDGDARRRMLERLSAPPELPNG